MERSRKVKPTLESLFFVTPEQKLMRFLLSEPTTSFTPRVLSSKLKGVRGLGGVEGINKILETLAELGIIQYLDNNRAICLHNENLSVRLMKVMAAVCDLESLNGLLGPVSTKGILFGSRASGEARSDSDYDLFVVSNTPEEVSKLVLRHPLGKKIELLTWTPNDYLQIGKRDPDLSTKLQQGIVMWGSSW